MRGVAGCPRGCQLAAVALGAGSLLSGIATLATVPHGSPQAMLGEALCGPAAGFQAGASENSLKEGLGTPCRAVAGRGRGRG